MGLSVCPVGVSCVASDRWVSWWMVGVVLHEVVSELLLMPQSTRILAFSVRVSGKWLTFLLVVREVLAVGCWCRVSSSFLAKSS